MKLKTLIPLRNRYLWPRFLFPLIPYCNTNDGILYHCCIRSSWMLSGNISKPVSSSLLFSHLFTQVIMTLYKSFYLLTYLLPIVCVKVLKGNSIILHFILITYALTFAVLCSDMCPRLDRQRQNGYEWPVRDRSSGQVQKTYQDCSSRAQSRLEREILLVSYLLVLFSFSLVVSRYTTIPRRLVLPVYLILLTPY